MILLQVKKSDAREFSVPGRPMAKQRPRLWKGRAYTPQATRDYEEKVKDSYLTVHGSKTPFETDVSVDLFIVYNRRNHGDIDNVCKSILDGLNKIAWKDDKQVKHLNAVLVVDKVQPERVDVTIRAFGSSDLAEAVASVSLGVSE